MDLLSFEEALRVARDVTNTQHVLLGNGFSIACRPDCFVYDTLLREADFSGASVDIRQIFEVVGTADFERIIDLLRTSALLVEHYGVTDPDLAHRLRHDADAVRDALARVLASKHPDRPFDISDAEYAATRRFLSNFTRIYTLNYDMLLYWAVMQDMEPLCPRNDGFGAPDDPDAPYVEWSPYATYTAQRVFFLHGGLHLYDAGTTLEKITFARTDIPLVEQIREALASGRYPLVVTEGSSGEKLEKILHSAYLNHAIRSFSSISGALFVYGHSLASNDDHVLRRITEGRLTHLYVSLHGDPENATNRGITARAAGLASDRPASASLAVAFFDAASATVWRESS